MTYRIVKYKPPLQADWDSFIEKSMNGNFLHKRSYMDYHASRFQDASIMIYEKETVKAVFPAHQIENNIYSHNGLTYGDFIFLYPTRIANTIKIMQAAFQYFQQNGIDTISVKTIPWFFQPHPTEMTSYLYFQMQAKLQKAKAFFLLKTNDFKFNKDRKNHIKKLKKLDLTIHQGFDFLPEFWKIVTENLAVKYQTKPVHSLQEISQLMQSFADKIQLYVIQKDAKILGGAIIYLFQNSLHFQYIHSDPHFGKGHIDWLILHIIEKYKAEKEYISFGSSEEGNNQLNEGLAYWKESFGSRIFLQDFYKIDITKASLLNDILL